MGVYCFKWKRGMWFKVGHYAKNNPWSRFAHRGWASVIVPDPAISFARTDDFTLLFWNPNFGTKQERRIHTAFGACSFGEWYPDYMLDEVLDALGRESNLADTISEDDAKLAACTRKRL